MKYLNAWGLVCSREATVLFPRESQCIDKREKMMAMGKVSAQMHFLAKQTVQFSDQHLATLKSLAYIFLLEGFI